MPDNGIIVKLQDGVAHKILDRLRKIPAVIKVGFPAGMQHETKKKDGSVETMESAELAKILTFGSSIIPPRPFLEEGIKSDRVRIKRELEKQLKKEIENAGSGNFDKIGTMAVGAIQEFVRGEYYRTNVPNAPRTIEEKGSDLPLINTGNLVNSVTYIVDERKRK